MPGAGNLISGNGDNGITVTGSSTTGNIIRGNRSAVLSADGNGGLGIDLGNDGVTANDAGDADSGPNTFQNYPVLTTATSDATSTTVDGALNSAASTIFTLDFYASPTCDASGSGEGASYLGAGEVTTGADGNITFSITVPTAAANGWAITATATDPGGNTSEFSACVTVTSTGGGAPPQSDDPIFDAVDLPHDPALGPTVEEGVLVAEQDAYQSTLDLDGITFAGLLDGQIVGGPATFSLATAQQGADPVTLPPPDPLTGNPDAVAGWLTQDSIVLRQRLAGLYEIAALRAEGVELAYLLTAPLSASGDLTLTTAIDSELEPYPTSVGVLLLDADGNGLHIGQALAVDANGDSIVVAVQSTIINQQSAMSLVVPSDWLAQAAYPILIDPIVQRWQTNSHDRTPAIAYDAEHNRVLVVYTSGNALYTRLVSAEDGTVIHQAQLDTFPGMTTPSVVFDDQQNEYLVTSGQGWVAGYWRIGADGIQVGNKKLVAFGWYPWSFIESVDIASSGNGAGLVVWSDGGIVRGWRISPDGSWQGSVLDIATSIAYERDPVVAYDAALGAYVVTWQQDGEIWARTVTPGGTMGTPFQVSDDPGQEFDVDMAYSPQAGQTLVVWSSDEDGNSQIIQARRLLSGALASPVFTVGQTVDVDQFPRATGSQTSGWMVTWQRTDPDLNPPDDDTWLSLVPGDAGSDLTPLNRSIRETTTANESHPAIALRGDDVAMVALVETTSQGSAIVLVLDTQGPFGDYDWHYTYDALGRMTSACSDWLNGECFGNVWQYTYDAAGNPLLFDHWDAEARRTVMAQYIINGANQVECADDPSGDRHCDDGELLWEYDPYGHLKYDGVTHYTYDTAGRLSTVTIWDDEINADVTTTYTYNGDGERVSQSDNSDIIFPPVTTYTLDVVTSAVLAETTRGTTAHYLNGLATIAQSDGITTTYLQYDGAGSVRQITNPSGVVQYSQTFDPYGNLYRKTAGNGSTIGFGGGIHDANGLVYSQGKYYAPTQGRFIRQQLDAIDKAFSQFHFGPTGTPMTWDAFQAKIPQVGQDIINRSEMSGLSPTMEFLGEAFLFNAKTLWESPMVQTTISLGQIAFSPNSNREQRFFASREIALNTAMPIAEFGLLMYSPVTFMFPTTTADVMMSSSASDIIRIAQAQQYAEDAARFARFRAAEAEVAGITQGYLPNGLTIIGDGSVASAEAAALQYADDYATAIGGGGPMELSRPWAKNTMSPWARIDDARANLMEVWDIPTPQVKANGDTLWEAHHIVAKGIPDAQAARDVLARYNIDLDSPANLVWLPDYAVDDSLDLIVNNFDPAPLAHHNAGIHTTVNPPIGRRIPNIQRVNGILVGMERAGASRGQIILALNEIGNGYLQGVLP